MLSFTDPQPVGIPHQVASLDRVRMSLPLAEVASHVVRSLAAAVRACLFPRRFSVGCLDHDCAAGLAPPSFTSLALQIGSNSKDDARWLPSDAHLVLDRGLRMSRSAAGSEIRVGRQSVHLTRPEKVLLPEDRIDKRELAEYDERIATTMLPGNIYTAETYERRRVQGIFNKGLAPVTKKYQGRSPAVRGSVCSRATTGRSRSRVGRVFAHGGKARGRPQESSHEISPRIRGVADGLSLAPSEA